MAIDFTNALQTIDALFEQNPEEEKDKKEVINEGNIEIANSALAPGTISPTENNINTNIETNNGNVEVISAGDSDEKGDAEIQKQLLEINLQQELSNINTEYDTGDLNLKGQPDFFKFTNLSNEEEDLKTIEKILEAEDQNIQRDANIQANRQIQENLPTEKPINFANQDELDAFVEKTFDDLFKQDPDIARIQDTILKENIDILAKKQAELQGEMRKYKTYIFPKNYFAAIGYALTGIETKSEEFTITPEKEKAEKELELLNNEYATFVNNLILNDNRFKERIEYIEKGLYNSLNPLIEESEKKQAIANLRAEREATPLFGADKRSIDNLGFGINSVALVQALTGSDKDSWVRKFEDFFGFEEFELSDSARAGLEMLSLDKPTQNLLMDDFANDLDYYNSHIEDKDKYNNRTNKYEHKRDKYRQSKQHLLPQGDDSYVWYNEKEKTFVPEIFNYREFNRETGEYSNPIYWSSTGINQSKPLSGQFKTHAEERGWKLMRFGDAKEFIEEDLADKSKLVLDRAVEIMDKEAEKGLFTQEQFTDFLTNVAQGNMADAIRFLPKVVLKQVPYMAANFFSAGFYTMLSEGGNIGFDIIQEKAAKQLGIDPSELNAQQMLDWVENNPEEFDKAFTVGLTAGGAIAGLERAGIGYIIKSAKYGMSSFTQLLKGNIKKALSQTKAVASTNLKSGFNEAITEGLQTGVEQFTLGRFNALEYVNAMGEGFIGGITLPGLGSVTAATTQQIVELARNTRLNIKDPKLYDKVNKLFQTSRTQLDQEYKAGEISEKVYEERLQEISNDRNTLLKIPTYFDVEAKSETFDIYNLIKQKQKELEAIGDDKGLGKPIIDEINILNEKLGEIYAEQGLNRQIGSLNAIVDEAGDVTMQTFDTKDEANDFIEEQNKSGNWDSKASKDGSGVILQNKETGKQLFIVDKETAAEVRDIAVADHEFLHALIFQTVKDNPKAQAAMGKSLLNILDKMDKDGRMTSLLKERYDFYKGQPIEQQYEEALTFFADAIINEEINVNDGVISKIGRILRNLLQNLPFVNISFKNDKDVYNFVKDYALRRRAGKGLNAAQKRMLNRAATVGDKLGQGVSTQITDIIENQAGNLNKAFAPQSKRTAQDLMLQYQQEGADMDIDLTQDLINQYYNLGLTAMGYSREAGDIQVQDALNFLNSEFPSIARNFSPDSGSLSNYIRNTIGQRGKGFFKAEIERKKRTVSKEKLEDKGRQIVDTDQQTDFDQRSREDRGRAKVYPSSIKVIENNITGEIRTEQTTNIKDDINRAIAGGKTNPKQVAQTIVEQTKTKEYRAPIKKALGRWNSEQYNNNVDKLVNKAFIKTLPIAQIKRRFGKLFNIKEIDRVPTVKVENGKRTDFKKPVYLIPEVTPQKITEVKDYFKSTEKRHQSLMSLIAEGVAVEQMEEIKNDTKFMNDLQGRLEIKGSNLTADQFMNEVIFNLDKRNLEDKSFDVAKASVRKTRVQKISKSLRKALKITQRTSSDIVKEKGYTALPPNWQVMNDKQKLDSIMWLRSVLPMLGSNFINANNLAFSSRAMFGIPNKKGGKSISINNIKLAVDGKFPETLTINGKTYRKGTSIPVDSEGNFNPNGEFKADKIIYKKGLNKLSTVVNAKTGNRGYKNKSAAELNALSNTKEWHDANKPTGSKMNYLYDFTKIMEADLKINPGNLVYWELFLRTSANNMGHIVRITAPITYWSKEDGSSADFREEHNPPQNNIVQLLLDMAVNSNVDENFDLVRYSYNQGKLLITDDNKLDLSKLSEKSPDIYYTSQWNNNLPFVRLINPEMNAQDGGINTDNYNMNPTGNQVITMSDNFGFPTSKNNADQNKFKNELLYKVWTGDIVLNKAVREYNATKKVAKQSKRSIVNNKNNLFNLIKEDGTTESMKNLMTNADKAAQLGRKINKPTKGISVFDFDDTLAFSESKVIVNVNNKTFKITPAQFAVQAESLENQGAEFDFSEFDKVINGRKGPLADLALKRQDKFGSGDIFVLTARPQASASSIQKFLKGIGLNLPVQNITGLSDGKAESKALWILDKASEGYNDFYFADDSLANVQAVKNILDQIDVKSDVQIAKQSMRKRINKEFNIIIEQQSGKEWFKTYSEARAKVQGRAKNRFEFFIPPSAEDFMGLMYKLLPKGKEGDQALKWIKDHLVDTYNKAEQEVIAAKISVANDFNELRNSIDNIPDNLQKQAGYSNFTWSQALRVYMWNMQGMDIPGLSVRDNNALVKLIEDNADMKVFAEKIAFIQKNKEYPGPGANWVGGSITSDIINSIQKTFRKQALQEWQENVDIIFSKENMNKLEALYGSNYVVALNNILNRMKRGNNRPVSSSKQVENVIDWLNNSVGTIMFLNRKSALLQLISSINFINWSDNNIAAAGRAFANQPQYWKDVMYLMNSDYLVQRRNGMRINVAESEIADASKKGGLKGVIAYLLNKGFIFTRIADSLAIATGGATFYRNRVNSLQKQVNIDTGKLYTKAEAEAKAFEDFYQISEESQQSSRADRISMQQASGLGRLVLNFANTPMQYARIIKKSTKDLLAGRGDWKTNLSKILYYGAVQNLIFSGLQAALFTILFDEEEEKKDRTTSDKAEDIGFNMLSSLLRGLGYGGALVDTIIAVSREIAEQQGKKSPDYEEAVWNVFDFSPAIDSKVRKLRSAANTFKFNRKEIERRGFSLENPAYLALGQFVSSTLNVPLDRVLRMAMTLKQASDQDIALWQRIALIAGYSSWSVNLPYWGTTTTIEREAQEDEEIKIKYKKDTEKLKDKGFKRIPMTKGKPAGELGKDFITVTRPSGSIEYWLMPKK